MSASSSTSSASGERQFFHQIERDYSIQCDDVSALVSVADFKQRCRELREAVFTTHVTQDDSEPEREIAEACKSVGHYKYPHITILSILQYINNKAQQHYW